MKPLHWIGSSLRDVRAFPEDVRAEVGYSIYLAQEGGKALTSVPLVGFGGAKVLEVVVDDDGETYRAVYAVKFLNAIYVLHAFQKKSKKDSETPKQEIDLVKSRLKVAELHHQQNYKVAVRRGKKNERGA